MSEPIVYFGIGFLLAAVLAIGVKLLARSWVARLAVNRLHSAAPGLMADIEADMGQLHAQIAMATPSRDQRRADEGQNHHPAVRERTIAVQALTLKERETGERLRVTESELAVKSGALEEVARKLNNEKAELDDLMAYVDARDKLAEAERRHAAAIEGVKGENRSLQEQLGQSYDEITRLEHEMATLKRQVEAT